MSEAAASGPSDDQQAGPSRLLITVIAIATGALVANLYYAQPLVAAIGPDLGISPDLTGSVVSITQIGYGIGLFFLVSLADLIENKRLVMINMALTVIGLIGMGTAGAAAPFFAAALLIGISSTAAQVLVPFAAHLAPPEKRGQVVGNIMGGLLTGIMLARPVSLFIAASFGWRAVFWLSAMLMILIAAALARYMPKHQPDSRMHYGQVLASMAGLLRELPALRWRATYQALLFAAFNLFWTAAPVMLAERFGMSQHGIGLFALAGAGGALAAPITGWLADKGLSQIISALAMGTLGVSFLLTGWSVEIASVALLVVLTIGIDAAVQANQIVSQRIIFSARPEARGRINALYMTITFAGGAVGSVLGTLTYHQGGWPMTAVTGGIMGLGALALFGIERRGLMKRAATSA